MNFKDLKIWQLSHQLTLLIYKITLNFPKSEIFGITSQLRRSSSSIPANIAEGFGRKGKKEFIQYLYQAKGSLYETQNFIILSKDLKYINTSISEDILDKYESKIKLPLDLAYISGGRKEVEVDSLPVDQALMDIGNNTILILFNRYYSEC